MSANRCADNAEQCVEELRKEIKENSVRGEHGTDAILREKERILQPNALPTIADYYIIPSANTHFAVKIR
ncbi:MAG: hypothetical protein LBJ67_16375 [Planctomycetaceae bacterium]|nr:hypothetical protein [Planctomycetaceae bacterium]